MLRRLISISHRLFRCRYSNSKFLVANSPSFFRPHRKSASESLLTDYGFRIQVLDSGYFLTRTRIPDSNRYRGILVCQSRISNSNAQGSRNSRIPESELLSMRRSLKVGLPVLGLYGSYETTSDRQRRTVFWSLVNGADEQDL